MVFAREENLIHIKWMEVIYNSKFVFIEWKNIFNCSQFPCKSPGLNFVDGNGMHYLFMLHSGRWSPNVLKVRYLQAMEGGGSQNNEKFSYVILMYDTQQTNRFTLKQFCCTRYQVYYSQSQADGRSRFQRVNWWSSASGGLYRHPLLPRAADVYQDFNGRTFFIPVLHVRLP